MPQRTQHQDRNHKQRRKLNAQFWGRYTVNDQHSAKTLFESVKEVFKNGRKMYQKFVARRGASRGA
jgi:hypothetical protein